MAERFMQTVLTPSVLAAQQHYFGRRANLVDAPTHDPLTGEERVFIEARDSFTWRPSAKAAGLTSSIAAARRASCAS